MQVANGGRMSTAAPRDSLRLGQTIAAPPPAAQGRRLVGWLVVEIRHGGVGYEAGLILSPSTASTRLMNAARCKPHG